MLRWEHNICIISETAWKYTKNKFRGGTCDPTGMDIFTMHHEGYGIQVRSIDNILRENFLPHIFSGKYKSLTTFILTLSKMMVKKAGLGLQNIAMLANKKILSLQHASMDMILSVMGEIKFSTDDHIQALREERRENKYRMISKTPNSGG